jgi:LuxR family quorum sensing-dependent transcriptional regulator
MPVSGDTHSRGRGSDDPRPCHLSVRQREALAGAAEGLAEAETARRLGISVVTVAHHLARARRKLGASSTAQAVGIAVACGWLNVETFERSNVPTE